MVEVDDHFNKGNASEWKKSKDLNDEMLNVPVDTLTALFSVAERPQHMLMRVSVGNHKEDIAAAIETYNLLSEKWFTHASPTLFNAGTNRPQLSR